MLHHGELKRERGKHKKMQILIIYYSTRPYPILLKDIITVYIIVSLVCNHLYLQASSEVGEGEIAVVELMKKKPQTLWSELERYMRHRRHKGLKWKQSDIHIIVFGHELSVVLSIVLK